MIDFVESGLCLSLARDYILDRVARKDGARIRREVLA